MTAVTPGSAELLAGCPFCGKPLAIGSRKVNPKAYCQTEDCYGQKMSVVNLDDPVCVKAWNTRLAAKPDEDGVREAQAQIDVLTKLAETEERDIEFFLSQWKACADEQQSRETVRSFRRQIAIVAASLGVESALSTTGKPKRCR